MASIACVVDTSILRHWQSLELEGRPLEDWLWREFDVKASEVVLREVEMQRPYWKSSSHFRKIERLVRESLFPVAQVDEVEKALLSDFVDKNLINSPKSKGERHNVCVSVIAVEQCKFAHTIFLTDDLQAITGFIASAFNTYKAGCIWTSYDFILFLYLKHRRELPLLAAQNILRDLTANITGYPMPEEWKQRLVEYWGRLGNLSRALAQL